MTAKFYNRIIFIVLICLSVQSQAGFFSNFINVSRTNIFGVRNFLYGMPQTVKKRVYRLAKRLYRIVPASTQDFQEVKAIVIAIKKNGLEYNEKSTQWLQKIDNRVDQLMEKSRIGKATALNVRNYTLTVKNEILGYFINLKQQIADNRKIMLETLDLIEKKLSDKIIESFKSSKEEMIALREKISMGKEDLASNLIANDSAFKEFLHSLNVQTEKKFESKRRSLQQNLDECVNVVKTLEKRVGDNRIQLEKAAQFEEIFINNQKIIKTMQEGHEETIKAMNDAKKIFKEIEIDNDIKLIDDMDKLN